MDLEENENIEQLLAPHSSEAQQKAALGRLSEMLEETYILNLPPSKHILEALDTFSRKKDAPPNLVRKATKVQQEYRIR